MNSPASCTTTMRFRSIYADDITNLEVEDREAITFESWLREYLLHDVFYEENEDAR